MFGESSQVCSFRLRDLPFSDDLFIRSNESTRYFQLPDILRSLDTADNFSEAKVALSTRVVLSKPFLLDAAPFKSRHVLFLFSNSGNSSFHLLAF